MLTLREPIKLNNRTVTTIGTSFGDRIRDNYNQLNAKLSPEDLLHIVSMPAEVFYAEGNQISIFNRNIKIENVNEQKIDIVNKLINRILVSGQNNFTYQDRTYISNHLNKLGIKDEKRFMSRITEMMSERKTQTKELKELTNRVDTLREKIPEVMDSIKKHGDETAAENSRNTSNLYLAENIYNRLLTDRIYDTVWNFNHIYHDENNITNKELNISEQRRNASFIKMNNLAQTIIGVPVNIVHYKGNIFEDNSILEEILNNNMYSGGTADKIPKEADISNEYEINNNKNYVNQYNNDTTSNSSLIYLEKDVNQTSVDNNISYVDEEVVKSQLVESSLYNLIEQVYESRSDIIDNGINTEINIGNAMFETASNTFSRYVENIVAPTINKAVSGDTYDSLVKNVLNYLEIQSIETTKEEIKSQLLEESVYNLIGQAREGRPSVIDGGSNIEISVGNTMFEAASNTFSKLVENIASPVVNKNFQEDTYDSVVNNALNHIETQFIEENKEEQIRNEIKQIDQQNIENENHYLRVMQELTERFSKERPIEPVPRSSRIKESLEALENPAEFILKYREENEAAKEKQNEERELYLEAYPQKVRPFLRYIDGIMKNKDSGIIKPSDPMDALSILNADIADVELSHKKEADTLAVNPTEDKTEIVEKLVERIKGTSTAYDTIEKLNLISEISRDIPLDKPMAEKLIEDLEISHKRQGEVPDIETAEKTKQELVKILVDQIKGSSGRPVIRENINHISQINRDINLVHKTLETINESEILERIDELRQEQRENRKVTETVTDDVVTTVNKVNNEERVVTETLNQTEITDIVRQNIISQMGELSEQVYSRIERKLQNEKIRRGF